VSAHPVPQPVRWVGVIVGLQGLAGTAFAIALLIKAITSAPEPGENVYALAGYFALVGAAVITVGVALFRGRRWARTPAVVVQILLLGAAWYAISGSARWAIGVPVVVLCIVVLVLLFIAPSREWATGMEKTDAESSGK